MHQSAGRVGRMKKRMIKALAWALAILIPDLITKALVLKHVQPWSTREIIPGFMNVVRVMNRGAAFGFLNSKNTDWQIYAFILITLVALCFMVYLLWKGEQTDFFFVTGLGLIMGGALGNLVDRIRLGQVVDFIDVHVGSLHWPSFNVADSGITLGALSVLISLYLQRRRMSGES